MSGTQHFSIRAAGSDRAFLRHFVGKFPLEVPDLAADPRGPPWEMQSEAVPTTDRRGAWHSTLDPVPVKTRNWRLSRPGARTYAGVPESGLGGNYFMLVKQRGSNDLVALPVDEWYTFRPEPTRAAATLEEAEARMAAMRRAVERIHPKLAEISRDTGEDVPLAKSGEEDEADSDEEWKNIKARAAGRTAAVRPVVRRPSSAPSREDDEDESEEAPKVVGAANAADEENDDKGEDWEHEEAAADDDLDMGGSEDEAVVPSPTRDRRGAARSDSEDEGPGGGGAEQVVNRTRSAIARIMRSTGLEDGDEDEDDEEDGDDLPDPGDGPPGAARTADGAARLDGDEDDGDDSEGDDLDRMASVEEDGTAVVAAGSRKRKPSPEPRAALPGAVPSSPPPPSGSRGVAVGTAGAKRARGTTLRSPSPSPVPTSRGGSPTSSGDVGGSATPPLPVTREEVVALLKRHGRMPLKEIAAAFKARVTGDARGFSALVKQIARLDTAPSADGTRYLVLRPGVE